MQTTLVDLRTPERFGVHIETQTPLAPYTTMKVGGPADYFARVQTVSQLIRLVRWARSEALPYWILGGGSNVLIGDAGVRGLVIYNRCRQVRIDEAPCCVFPQDNRPFVFAESGASMVLDQLAHVDQVAYIRFASVYLDINDLNELRNEIDRLMGRSTMTPEPV